MKKTHLLDKKLPADRNALLIYFIRKVLKELLLDLRIGTAAGQQPLLGSLDLYCVSQLCYEMVSV